MDHKFFEPPNGTRIEFQEYGSPGGDLTYLVRDDKESLRAGWPAGDGGNVWLEAGTSVPMTWDEVLADPRLAAAVDGTYLVPRAGMSVLRAERDEMRKEVNRLNKELRELRRTHLDTSAGTEADCHSAKGRERCASDSRPVSMLQPVNFAYDDEEAASRLGEEL